MSSDETSAEHSRVESPSPERRRSAPASGRGKRTRDRILRAAVKVFGERGFTDTNILAIAQEANVASGTVYQYFTDKADLFSYLLFELQEKLRRETRMPADEEGRLVVHDSVVHYLEVYREYAPIYRAWWELLEPRTEFTDAWLSLHGQSRREMTRVVRSGQQAGTVDAGIDPELTADLMLCMFDRPAYTRIVLGWDDELTDEAMADLMTQLLGHGLGR
jgi:AcrR family transcriptional regulator